jgi:serine/threonine-protein kinase
MALPNTQKIPIGVVLSGKYRITRELGRGGMAAVYEAENVDIGKRVAIKVLAQELSSSTVVVERFLREARAAAATSTTRAGWTTVGRFSSWSCSWASPCTSA